MNGTATSGGILVTLRNFVWYSLLRVPWLIAYNVVGAALLVGFFGFMPQGEDLLRLAAERGFDLAEFGLLWNLLLLLATLAASVSFWYTSRVLLARDYPAYPLPREYSRLGRRWWPRIAGIAVPLSIAWTFREMDGEGASEAMLLAWLYLGMAVLLLAFYVLRRLLFSLSSDYMIATPLPEVPARDRKRARILLFGVLALLVLFVALPVQLPQWLGAPAIAVLGVMGIAIVGTIVLTYWPMSRGAPAATLTALLLALLFGLWNHNHPVRVADDAQASDERPTPHAQLVSWNEGAGAAKPLILVTASGGGIRAAYWTASVLAYLEQKLGTDFTDRLFAISGVSGGSVGAATYVTLKRAQLDAGENGSLLPPVREVLGHDFLSPVIAGILFPDLAQRFLPFPITLADRQRFLERAFELAFDGDARDLFRGPFRALYVGTRSMRLPSLLLNTTVVETGQRAVVSNLQVGALPGVVDLLDERYQLSAIRTSAAAGASARFTYVSPAGRVDIAGGDSIRLVDGGYFENSGAATMGDLIAQLVDSGQRLRPILLIISNDPTAANLCGRDDGEVAEPAGGRFNANVSEVISPLQALLNTRGARQQIAEVKAARLVEAMGGSVIEVPLAAVLRARLQTLEAATPAPLSEETINEVRRRYLEPPLGWSLSQEVRSGMDQTIDDEAGGLASEFDYLVTALGGDSIPPCKPR